MNYNSKENRRNLLSDKEFIDWILFPSKESDNYWKERMNNDPEMAKEIRYLKQTVQNLQTKESKPSSIDQVEVWNAIKYRTINKKQKNTRNRNLLLSAAASIAVLIVGYMFFFSQKTDTSIDYDLYMKQANTNRQSKDIELVLANNKTISIEENTVDLVYDQEGSVSVNAQKINDERSSEMNQLTVPYGKSSTLTLSDGTKVYINSGSKLIYPATFDKHKREIYVDGEIYLNVTKEANRPFIVKTSQLEVKVLGTSFNVNAYGNTDHQSIVLAEGVVSVKSQTIAKKQKLQPNQMYSYNNESETAVVENVDASKYTAWIHGYMLFEKTSLEQVLIKVERYYNTSILYEPSSMRDVKITGKLDLNSNIEEIMNHLMLIAPITYKMHEENEKEIITLTVN